MLKISRKFIDTWNIKQNYMFLYIFYIFLLYLCYCMSQKYYDHHSPVPQIISRLTCSKPAAFILVGSAKMDCSARFEEDNSMYTARVSKWTFWVTSQVSMPKKELIPCLYKWWYRCPLFSGLTLVTVHL